MAINVKILGKSMIEAARRAASQQWGEVAPVAETQLQTLAEAAGEIEALLRLGHISDDRARELFAMQRTAVQSVLQRDSKAPASTMYDYPRCFEVATILCHSNCRADKTDFCFPDWVYQKIEAAGIRLQL